MSYVGEELHWSQTGDQNYLARHWNGHLPLSVSYWVNGIAIPLALTWGAGAGLAQLGRTDLPLRWLMVGSILYLALAALVWVWSMVGIWRSAENHEERGGAAGWANLARFMVVIGALGAIGQLHNRFMYLVEAAQLAVGQDPIGEMAAFSVQADGKSAMMDGLITAGSAAKFGDFVAAHPGIHSISLRSRGGRMLEADRMAKLISKRGLNTEAQEYCMSACTMLLLAGRERAATQDARVGFHQPQFPGLSDAEQRAMTEDMRQNYLKAGVDPKFLDKAMTYSPDNMWFPTTDELLEAKVITTSPIIIRSRSKQEQEMRDQQLQRYLDFQANQINSMGARRIDNVTVRTGARAGPKVLTIRFKVNGVRSQIDTAAVKREMRPVLAKQICGDQKTSLAVDAGATFVFSYYDRNGASAFSIPISKCEKPDSAG